MRFLFFVLVFGLLWPGILIAAEVPTLPTQETTQEAINRQRVEMSKKYYDAVFEDFVLRREAFTQQRYVGWIILGIVSLISVGGFLFSLFLILKASSVPAGDRVSDLEITLQRIKLSSIQTASLVGLVVYLSSLVL